MDNSGQGPLRVPGFGGIPIQHELQPELRFAHAMAEWRQAPPVTELELAMVRVMNAITDSQEWTTDVFNNSIVIVWKRNYGSTYPLLGDRAWNWCLRELRDKATAYKKEGYTRVLDTGSVICKSDSLATSCLVSGLNDSTKRLFDKEHSRTSATDTVRVNIVDPQMYPLVYAEAPVLQDDHSTSIDNFLNTSHVRRAHKQENNDTEAQYDRDHVLAELRSGRTRYDWWDNEGAKAMNYFFFSNFQSLPCEVETGDTDGKVRLTSYINNLHPRHSSTLYEHIEHIVSLAIEPWNACLIKGFHIPKHSRTSYGRSGRLQCGRIPSRITSFGSSWINELPLLALYFNQDFPHKSRSNLQKIKSLIAPNEENGANSPSDNARLSEEDDFPFQEITRLPGLPAIGAWEWAEEYLSEPCRTAQTDLPSSGLPEDWRSNVWRLIAEKAIRRQESRKDQEEPAPIQPGSALSYDDWSSGCWPNP